MDTLIRFKLQYNEDEININPIYKDDISIEWSKETNQEFFRPKLSGKIQFVKEDFEIIDNAPFETKFIVIVEQSKDYAQTWEEIYKGYFYKTDCSFDLDNKIISVLPNTLDQYTDVLNGLENEYNLIELAPVINPLVINKRPLIQIYKAGDSVLSCFLSGMSWEQECEEVDNEDIIKNQYYFQFSGVLKTVVLKNSGASIDAQGTYLGDMTYTKNGNNERWFGRLNPTADNGYFISFAEQREYIEDEGWAWFVDAVLIRQSDLKDMYSLHQRITEPNKNYNAVMSPTEETERGIFGIYITSNNIYGRYLLDVESMLGTNTYQIPTNDITENNRNYKRVIGYPFGSIISSTQVSETPTEYGKNDDGKYFEPPTDIEGIKYYPVARSTWGIFSLWFYFNEQDEELNKSGTKPYILRDTYPISSVVNVLLKKIAPNITHEEAAEYSQFLYGERNPISGEYFRLSCTPKSNILVGEYQTPALKAPTTLLAFLNMLKNVFQCYWFIEDNKFKIEHISFFKNGGSYSRQRAVILDLGNIFNVRNGKAYSYAKNKYDFDKLELTSRYQFEWMDEVSAQFQGDAIQVKSAFVQEDKVEDISISGFTSDVDYILLNPVDISKDGFCLFASVGGDVINTEQTLRANNDYTEILSINTLYNGKMCAFTLEGRTINGDVATANLFFYSNGERTTNVPLYVDRCDGEQKKFNLLIPRDVDAIGFYISGNAVVKINAICYDMQTLPIVSQTIKGVTYRMQNGFLAMTYLQPTFFVYNMPSFKLEINGEHVTARGIMRKKKQDILFPNLLENYDFKGLIKTSLGFGELTKFTLSLLSQSINGQLNYDTTSE